MTDTETDASLLNVTWHGACPSCQITTAFTGYRTEDTPGARAKLGTVAERLVRCPVCGEADIQLRCVGVCLDPFVAREDDPEPDEDEEDDDDHH
jgi:hypothetical protein